jgi:hypothetical protein
MNENDVKEASAEIIALYNAWEDRGYSTDTALRVLIAMTFQVAKGIEPAVPQIVGWLYHRIAQHFERWHDAS